MVIGLGCAGPAGGAEIRATVIAESSTEIQLRFTPGPDALPKAGDRIEFLVGTTTVATGEVREVLGPTVMARLTGGKPQFGMTAVIHAGTQPAAQPSSSSEWKGRDLARSPAAPSAGWARTGSVENLAASSPAPAVRAPAPPPAVDAEYLARQAEAGAQACNFGQAIGFALRLQLAQPDHPWIRRRLDAVQRDGRKYVAASEAFQSARSMLQGVPTGEKIWEAASLARRAQELAPDCMSEQVASLNDPINSILRAPRGRRESTGEGLASLLQGLSMAGASMGGAMTPQAPAFGAAAPPFGGGGTGRNGQAGFTDFLGAMSRALEASASMKANPELADRNFADILGYVGGVSPQAQSQRAAAPRQQQQGYSPSAGAAPGRGYPEAFHDGTGAVSVDDVLRGLGLGGQQGSPAPQRQQQDYSPSAGGAAPGRGYPEAFHDGTGAVSVDDVLRGLGLGGQQGSPAPQRQQQGYSPSAGAAPGRGYPEAFHDGTGAVSVDDVLRGLGLGGQQGSPAPQASSSAWSQRGARPVASPSSGAKAYASAQPADIRPGGTVKLTVAYNVLLPRGQSQEVRESWRLILGSTVIATFENRFPRQAGVVNSEHLFQLPANAPPGLYTCEATVQAAGLMEQASVLLRVAP